MAAFCGHGKMENFKLKSFDGTELYCYLFDKVENPKGVVMVVHGMGEHMGRYIHFAEYLNSRGYIVFGDDHRGHGFSETDADRGHHDGDMFSDTVKDEVFFLKYLEDRYKLPVLFFGHSYGSFWGSRFWNRAPTFRASRFRVPARCRTLSRGSEWARRSS